MHLKMYSDSKEGITVLGKPKYKVGDKVSFEFDGIVLVGEVYIVDDYGTFEQNEETSYDVMVGDEYKYKGLHKHIRESNLTLFE